MTSFVVPADFRASSQKSKAKSLFNNLDLKVALNKQSLEASKDANLRRSLNLLPGVPIPPGVVGPQPISNAEVVSNEFQRRDKILTDVTALTGRYDTAQDFQQRLSAAGEDQQFLTFFPVFRNETKELPGVNGVGLWTLWYNFKRRHPEIAIAVTPRAPPVPPPGAEHYVDVLPYGDVSAEEEKEFFTEHEDRRPPVDLYERYLALSEPKRKPGERTREKYRLFGYPETQRRFPMGEREEKELPDITYQGRPIGPSIVPVRAHPSKARTREVRVRELRPRIQEELERREIAAEARAAREAAEAAERDFNEFLTGVKESQRTRAEEAIAAKYGRLFGSVKTRSLPRYLRTEPVPPPTEEEMASIRERLPPGMTEEQALRMLSEPHTKIVRDLVESKVAPRESPAMEVKESPAMEVKESPAMEVKEVESNQYEVALAGLQDMVTTYGRLNRVPPRDRPALIEYARELINKAPDHSGPDITTEELQGMTTYAISDLVDSTALRARAKSAPLAASVPPHGPLTNPLLIPKADLTEDEYNQLANRVMQAKNMTKSLAEEIAGATGPENPDAIIARWQAAGPMNRNKELSDMVVGARDVMLRQKRTAQLDKWVDMMLTRAEDHDIEDRFVDAAKSRLNEGELIEGMAVPIPYDGVNYALYVLRKGTDPRTGLVSWNLQFVPASKELASKFSGVRFAKLDPGVDQKRLKIQAAVFARTGRPYGKQL